jgi:hypothetical protein
MALTGYNTLLQVAKLDAGAGYAVIDETIAFYPELSQIPAATMTGSTMELSVLKTLPTASFRNANEGTPRRTAEFETRVFQTAIVDQQCAVDIQGVLKASKDQARFLINNSKPHMKAVLNLICKQLYYGTTNDAKGFPGLVSQYAADTQHEVNAGGAANKSSVWFLQVGPENLELLFGNDQSITMNEDWKQETVYDSNNNPLQALTNWINGRVGFRLANKHAAVRIKNLAAATQTLTDALMYQALQKCEEIGMTPNLIIGAPRSFEQMRAARTTYSPSGAPAPKIRDWEGIPILSTVNVNTSEA